MARLAFWMIGGLIAALLGFMLIIGEDYSNLGFVLFGNGAKNQPDTIYYAEPAALGPVIIFVAIDQGFFEKQGLHVVPQKFSSGRLALDAVMTNNAQFGSTSETPFMHSVLQGNDVVVIATVSEHHEAKAIARKDKGIAKPKDLKGKKVATLPGTNSDYFMHLFLEKNGLRPSDLQIISMAPQEMVIALVRGDIDAYFAWEPHIFFAKKELGNKSVIFDSDGLYNGMHAVVMQREFVNKNPETVKKIIKAFLEAELFVKQNHEKTLEIAELHTGMGREALDGIYNDYRYEVRLSQELIELLNKESEWAMDSGVSKAAKKPDFRESVYTDALKEINSSRVKVK